MREPGSADPTFWSCKSGNAVLLFALLTPIIAMGVFWGMDATRLHARRQLLQDAADASAIAAATQLLQKAAPTAIKAEAQRVAAADGYDPSRGAMTVNSPPLSGSMQGQSAVEVLIEEVNPSLLGGLGMGPKTLSVRAVAAAAPGGTMCILALHPTKPKAAWFQGSSVVTLKECSVASNSSAADAVAVQGSSHLTADCLYSVGGALISSSLSLSSCSAPHTNSAKVQDPYASLQAPSPGPCKGMPAEAGVTYHCGGLTLSGVETLGPGVHYIAGGPLKVMPNSQVSGAGVTIFLAPDADLSLPNNAMVDLAAPTTGAYAGVLFFADKAGGGSVTFNGTATSSMTGALYFPSRDVTYNGNYSGKNGCLQILANTVVWNGNSNISADCAGHGLRQLAVSGVVRLTE